MDHQQQQIHRAGLDWIAFSVPYLIVGILGIIGFFVLNTQLSLLQSTLPETQEYIHALCPTCGDYVLSISRIGYFFLMLSIISLSIGAIMAMMMFF